MKTAVVTGASSGIGAAVCKRLLDDNWLVYGIGRDFGKVPHLCETTSFFPIICDLKKFTDVEQVIRQIKEKAKKEIVLLVNNAGVGYFGLHEQLNPVKIHEMVAVNLEAPLIISNMLIRELKENEGMIINISSVTAKKSNPHGCAYGAAKAGLSNFGESLFDEVRKYGVRVVNIHPDMTESDFYRNADFTNGAEYDERLEADEIAEHIIEVINVRKGAVITDLTIKPQKHIIRRK